MTMTKNDYLRIAQGFKYIADDPTADHSTVLKLVQEVGNTIPESSRFNRADFVGVVFGYNRREVLNPWNNKRIECGACGYDLFYDRGRSLDTYNHECGRCGHMNHTLTETGMSA